MTRPDGLLKNIKRAGKTRQNPAKKGSLWLINVHFESNFNAVWPSAMVFEPSPRQAAGNLHRKDESLFSVRSLTPPQAARNALAIAVQQPAKPYYTKSPVSTQDGRSAVDWVDAGLRCLGAIQHLTYGNRKFPYHQGFFQVGREAHFPSGFIADGGAEPRTQNDGQVGS